MTREEYEKIYNPVTGTRLAMVFPYEDYLAYMNEHVGAKNAFNPENIQVGDLVTLKAPHPDDPKGPFKVSHVGGTHMNKISLEGEWPGHELYAQCFNKHED